ncbi:hypothetical protein pb186bvf_020201 [Paramecium bursaria]
MALAKQLKGLQSIKEQDYPSILFSKQVSSSYDIDAIYYIGLKGIKKLIQIDQNFNLYSQNLFSTDKKGINRQVLNQLDNDLLNVQLRACLKLLSKYFGFEGSHQVIEYLLRNYHINQHLPNECIIYFLQYHNTTIYTRLLQNIVEEQRENMWGFLYEPISRAQTISRDLIVRQMQLDYRILKQLLDYASEQLIPLEEPQDIIYDTNVELTQDDIIRIKQKQPSLLSFVFTILNQLNVNVKYFDQIRGTLGKLIAQCFELNTQESKSFVYLIYQQQLFNPEKLWLTQSQISNTATHVYQQSNQLELTLLYYQFGINTNEATSRQLLGQDIQELSHNPLLFMEVMKPLKNINLEDILYTNSVKYLRAILKKKYTITYVESLISILNPQLYHTLKPYLKNTQFYNLIPNSQEITLTLDNYDNVLDNVPFTQLSIQTLKSVVDDAFDFYAKTQEINFIKIIEKAIKCAKRNYPQANLIHIEQIHSILHITGYSLRQIINYACDQDQLVKVILLYSINNTLEEIIPLTKQIKIKPFNSNDQLYQEVYKNYKQVIDEIMNEQHKNDLVHQLQISLAFSLDKDYLYYLEGYDQDDNFLKETIKKLSYVDILNMNNELSVKLIKQINLDYQLYYNHQVSETGRLKIMLWFLKQEKCPVQFLIELFIIYEDLQEQERDLYLLLLHKNKQLFKQEIKYKKTLIDQNIISQTFLALLKHKKEQNYIKSLSNINQMALIQLHLLIYRSFDNKARLLKSLSLIYSKKVPTDQVQELVAILLNQVEQKFDFKLVGEYLSLIQYLRNPSFTFLRHIIKDIPDNLGQEFNSFLKFPSPSDIRTQVTYYVYSQNISNKSLFEDPNLDFEKLLDLFKSKTFGVENAIIQLFKQNIKHIKKETIIQLFSFESTYKYQIYGLIYDFIDINRTSLLNESITELKKYINSDLKDQIQYLIVSSIVRIISKHSQLKEAKKSFLTLVYPKENQLLYLKLVAQHYKFHNKSFFDVFVTPALLYKSYLQTDELSLSQISDHFSIFKPQKLWILGYILALQQQQNSSTKLVQDYLLSQKLDYLLIYLSALSESLNYKIWKNSQKLQLKQTKQVKFVTKELQLSLKYIPHNQKLKILFVGLGQIIDQLIEKIHKPLQSNQFQNKDLIKTIIICLYRSHLDLEKSKVGKFLLKIREKFINYLHIDILFDLLGENDDKTILKLLYMSLNSIMEKEDLKITKQSTQKILQLIQQIVDNLENYFSEEVALTLNHLFQHQTIIKQIYLNESLYNELLNKLISQLQNRDHLIQILILNVIGYASIQNNYFFIEPLNEIVQQLIINYQNYLEGEQQKDKNQYIITAAQNTIIGFKGLINKQQLKQLIQCMIIQNNQDSINILLQNIEQRIIYEILQDLVLDLIQNQSSQVIKYLAAFIKQLIESSPPEEVQVNYFNLTKLIIQVFDFIREKYIDSEVDKGILEADELEELFIIAMIEIITKISDLDLKKMYNHLLKWSNTNQLGGYNYSKYRKITFFKLSNRISIKLNQSFTKYYQFIFDIIINEMQQFHQVFNEIPKQTKLQKRRQNESDMYYKLELVLARHILTSIEYLCQGDQEQFLDTDKFDRLSEPLAKMLDTGLIQKYEPILGFLEEWTTPAILAVFQSINDDYKWKTLHTHILSVVSIHSNKKNEISGLICIGVVKLLQKLIDQLGDRYLVLMNDLIPYLHQLTFSQQSNDELENRVKQLITRLNQLSGEDLSTYLK